MDRPNEPDSSEHTPGQTPEQMSPEQMSFEAPGFRAPENTVQDGGDPVATLEAPESKGISSELMTDEVRAEHLSVPVEDVFVQEPRDVAPVAASAGGGNPGPPPPAGADEEDEEDGGMLRMSFMEHLEEMRSRIIRAIAGVGVSFLACLVFAPQIWNVVSAPAVDALTKLGVKPPNLAIIEPMEGFSVIWVKVPLIVALFLAAPWVVYQIWAFIAPGLYDKEKKWAIPFVTVTGGLFIAGGLFAYFIAFRYGLTFLLGIGLMSGGNVTPVVSITSYFDLFMNVVLGISLVFELPVVIFFLTLLRVASPRFLMQNSRYAVLLIVVLAAIITPTPDFFNLMIFAVPMCLLFYVGVFASYLLVLRREGRRFPWAKVLLVMLGILLIFGGSLYFVLLKLGYHTVPHWPFMVK